MNNKMEKVRAMVQYFQKEADNSSMAQASLGLCLEFGMGIEVDREQAFRYYATAAENGNLMGMYLLAKKFEEESNRRQAFQYYVRAAEQGCVDAMRMLEIYLSLGLGIEVNKEEAVKWCRKAAECGDKYAQLTLAVHYFEGEGVEKNLSKALMWCRRSMESGHSSAYRLLREIREKIKEEKKLQVLANEAETE